MITGSLPFTGRYEAAVMHAVVNLNPPPVSSVRRDVPDHLQKIVSRLLQKSPTDRYQTAGEVLTDLEQGREKTVANQGDAHRHPMRVRYIGYAAAVAAVAVLAFSLGWFSTGVDEVDRLHRTVAVLPFENLGPPADEYFADGMTDVVTMNLLRHGDLVVISRSSSMQYKRSERSIQDIGTELGAEYLLRGTVQKLRSAKGDRVRIGVRLVRVDDGASLWATTYDPPLNEVSALQSDIGEKVTRALKVAVGDTRKIPLPDEPTENLAAYDFYLRGNEYFNRDWDQDIIEIAIEMYGRAITLDSGYAAAYAMLSRGHASMYSENYDRSETRLLTAEAAAREAVSLDPNLPEAHLALGYCYYAAMAYDEALAEFAIVQQTQPNNRYVHNAIAAVQRRQGKLEQAAHNFRRALELDPRSHLRAFDVALTYGLMREYASAEAYLERAMLLAPNWPLPHVFLAWLAILDDGGVDRAREILDSSYGRVAISTSKYYWWLARIVEPNLEDALSKARPGADSVAYYLYCAQINRLLRRNKTGYQYADSARVRLEGRENELGSQAWFHSHLGLAYAGLGRRDEALANGMQAVELLPTSQEAFDALFLVANLAETLMIFKDYDSAVARLEELLGIPGFVTVPYLQVDPLWAPLRDHPRFQKLVQEAG
jgi:serine/threonine-protein kinase